MQAVITPQSCVTTDHTRPAGPAATALTLRDDERQRCEVWTRVMGYHRPTSAFNTGKQGEFKERQYFTEACLRPVSGH